MSFLKGLDLTVIFLICAISSFGLLAIFATEPKLAVQQLLVALFGILLFLAISSSDIRIFKDLAILFWVVSLVLVFSVTFFAPEIRGAARWIEIGFFRLQPTELAKPFVILALASIFSQDEKPTKLLLKSLVIVLPFVVLTFLQPDLGNAVIFALIWFFGLFVAGFNWKILAGALFLFILVLPLFLFVLTPYQRLRFETFLNPTQDPLGAGYSVIQSQIAVGAGKIFGRGLTNATQSKLEFLPEASTDFIFSSISEGLGFVGSVIFIALFFLLIYQLITKSQVSDRFSQIVILQVAGLIFSQFFINLAMSIGLLPVVGITLPFVSYGGSSLVASFVLVAFAQSQIRFAPKPVDAAKISS